MPTPSRRGRRAAPPHVEFDFPYDVAVGDDHPGGARAAYRDFARRARAHGLAVRASADYGGEITVSGPEPKVRAFVRGEAGDAELAASLSHMIRRPAERAR
jgi:hypothetical protein